MLSVLLTLSVTAPLEAVASSAELAASLSVVSARGNEIAYRLEFESKSGETVWIAPRLPHMTSWELRDFYGNRLEIVGAGQSTGGIAAGMVMEVGGDRFAGYMGSLSLRHGIPPGQYTLVATYTYPRGSKVDNRPIWGGEISARTTFEVPALTQEMIAPRGLAQSESLKSIGVLAPFLREGRTYKIRAQAAMSTSAVAEATEWDAVKGRETTVAVATPGVRVFPKGQASATESSLTSEALESALSSLKIVNRGGRDFLVRVRYETTTDGVFVFTINREPLAGSKDETVKVSRDGRIVAPSA